MGIHTASQRREALARTGLLDAPAEPGLTRLATLAARVLDAPLCLITLVDDDRQFFAAQAGSPGSLHEARETPLSHSFCQHVVSDEHEIVIEDARSDPRVADNPAIDAYGVIAFAGVPLATPEGVVYGSVCVIDHEPRTWSERDLEHLRALAEAAASEIEVRALLAEREVALATEREIRARLEAKRQRIFLLAKIGELTDAIDDHRELAQTVAMELVPGLCDWCIVEIEPDRIGDDVVVAIGAADESHRADIERLRTIARATPTWDSPTTRAYFKHEPTYVEQVEVDQFVTTGRAKDLPGEMNELLVRVGLGSILSMPLVAHERVLGSISYVRRDAVGFDVVQRELQGEIARRLASVVEATRLREALEERARAAEVIEAIGDGVVLVGGDGRVSLWNPAVAHITGVHGGEALGRDLAELAPQLAELASCPADPATSVMFELTRPDGDLRWVSVTSVHVDRSCVFALRDVTDEHLLEQTRHELIATVSHQLRTPVASILAAAVTLQRDDIELPPATISLVIDTIVEQSQRLVDLCSDVLLASRLDSGAHEVASDQVPLAPLLDEVVRAAQLPTGDTHTIVLELASEAPTVLGDAHGLRQLVGNLLDNAVKYSPDGGTITIRAREFAGMVQIDVQDPGIGIPVSEHDRVFERFYRLDPHMKRGVGGSGLGLYVARGLARLMGGRIDIDQPVEGGTRMIVTLPAA